MGQKSRINKYIAFCGVASRRAAELFILEGRIKVNGKVIRELGTQIDHDLDIVSLDGRRLTPAQNQRYIILHKPKNVITTMSDPEGRPTVALYLRNIRERVYPVGRLDFDTTGALLMTNDGDLAHRLAHPRYEVEKVYVATVIGEFTPQHSLAIAKGVKLEDGSVGRGKARALSAGRDSSKVEIRLREGRKHEVKDILAGCGLPVKSLHRLIFAGLSADSLRPGESRDLTAAEIRTLRKLAGY